MTLLFILEKQMCQVLQTLYKKNWNTKQTLHELSIWKIVNSIFSTWCIETQSLDWVQNKIKFHVKKHVCIFKTQKSWFADFSPLLTYYTYQNLKAEND